MWHSRQHDFHICGVDKRCYIVRGFDTKPTCILYLDFTAACDRISHTYLLWILMSYGYSLKFIRLIKAIYDKAFSLVQINGYLSQHNNP